METGTIEIEIPYSPRELQREIHDRDERFGIYVCHRRFGKTVACINELLRGAFTCEHENPRLAYIAPLYRQAKSVAWDYLLHYSRAIPGIAVNIAELRVDYPNGARISLYGADNPDSLRGLYLDGVVLDEYAQMSSRLWGEVIRPSLADRRGWGLFIGTPRGHGAFYDLYQWAKRQPDWITKMFRASQTGIVSEEELESSRQAMSPEEYEQEFELSWSAAIKGSYWGALIQEAEDEGRVCRVAHDPAALVDVWFDLGIGDSTAMWFAQRIGQERHLIDYYESSSEPLGHYVQKINESKWNIGDVILPHDAKQRELQTGQSRVEYLEDLGVKSTVLPNHRIDDRIEAVRRMLPACWFDIDRCSRGLDSLRQYRADYDERNRTLRSKPVHDWASHGADAFGYGAMSSQRTKTVWAPIEYDNRGIV